MSDKSTSGNTALLSSYPYVKYRDSLTLTEQKSSHIAERKLSHLKCLVSAVMYQVLYHRQVMSPANFYQTTWRGRSLRCLRFDKGVSQEIKEFCEWMCAVYEGIDQQLLSSFTLEIYGRDPDCPVESYTFALDYSNLLEGENMSLDDFTSSGDPQTETAFSNFLEDAEGVLGNNDNLPLLPVIVELNMILRYYADAYCRNRLLVTSMEYPNTVFLPLNQARAAADQAQAGKAELMPMQRHFQSETPYVCPPHYHPDVSVSFTNIDEEPSPGKDKTDLRLIKIDSEYFSLKVNARMYQDTDDLSADGATDDEMDQDVDPVIEGSGTTSADMFA